MSKKLKIAICGIRGIPACYGGFETFAEELSTRLSARGHEVCVYGRKHVIHFAEKYYRGVELRLLPAPRHKYLETPVHSLLCFLDLLRRDVDVVLVCNAANSPFVWLLRLARIPVAVNVDGIERLRGKWNAFGRIWYRLGERASVWFASRIVSDADVIAKYYLETYQAESTTIGYGFREPPEDVLQAKLRGEEHTAVEHTVFNDLGIQPGKYLLYVSRLEPENNAHRVIEAYNALEESAKDFPLVIVGDAPYAQDYISSLHRMAGRNVIFAGYRFGDSYEALQLGAYVYVQATEVGGTHPALVEAMGYANCVVANGTPENIEVLAGAGLVYAKNSTSALREVLSKLVLDKGAVIGFRKQARERASDCFSWENICSEYERLFFEMTA